MLDREDFLRLNHEMAFRVDYGNEMRIDDDEVAHAERIFLNDDILPSVDLEVEDHSDLADDCQKRENYSQQHSRSNVSSSYAVSGINGNLLSEETNTLSVKLLNIMNVLNITSDEITPAEKWDDIYYFTSQAKQFLKRKIASNEIDPQCSYGWPHIMRTNSLLLIGEPIKNLLLCLPTVCSIKVSHIFIFILKNFVILTLNFISFPFDFSKQFQHGQQANSLNRLPSFL